MFKTFKIGGSIYISFKKNVIIIFFKEKRMLFEHLKIDNVFDTI